MIKPNYDEWFATWDDESRTEMEARNRKEGRNERFWIEKWKDAFAGYSDFVLSRRVDAGPFVIIEFRASKGEQDQSPMVLDVPVKAADAGKWYASQSAGGDPVLLYWRTPGTVTEVVGRQPPDLSAR
jgi:hypothetical protein